jgi:quercetin dioxygenase-like cupin family protein
MKLVGAVVMMMTAAWAVQAPVPVSQEHHHHFKFENDYVRVYDVSVPAHDDTLFHIHSNDYVFVNLTDVNLKAQVLGGPEVALPVKTGQCVFSKAPITHRVLNPSDNLFRNITIEVLKTPPLPSGPDAMSGVPGFTREFENDRVRIDRLVLEPGQSTGMFKQNLMNLAVAVTGGSIAKEEQGAQEKVDELQPGNFEWHGDPKVHSLRNAGNTRFEAVFIEWK